MKFTLAICLIILMSVLITHSQSNGLTSDSIESSQRFFFTNHKLKKEKLFNRLNFNLKNRNPKDAKDFNLANIFKNRTYKSEENGNLQIQKFYWQEIGPIKIDSVLSPEVSGLGRVNCIAFHPLDSLRLLIGNASGGIWFSNDYGKNWVASEFNNLPIVGISDILFNNDNPNYAYAATGDFDGNSFFGGYSIGILESSDAGKSWHLINGFDYSEQNFISKMVLINDELFYSTNNGIKKFNIKSKSNSILVNSGVYSDLVFNANINQFFTAKWNLSENSEIQLSNFDFTQIKTIWQDSLAGRIKLHLSNFDTTRLYSLVSKAIGGSSLDLIYTEDHGKNWISKAKNIELIDYQGFYNIVLTDSPKNKDEIFCGGVKLNKKNINKSEFLAISNRMHNDFHSVKFHPVTKDLFALNDGGVFFSSDNGSNWKDLSDGLSLTQIYKFALNPFNDSILYIGAQDNGIIQYNYSKWKHILSGDGMITLVDDSIPDLVYSSIQKGIIGHFDKRISHFEEITQNLDTACPIWLCEYKLHPNSSEKLIVAYSNIYEIDTKTNFINKLTNFTDNKAIDYFQIDKNNPKLIYLSKNKLLLKSNDYGLTWDTIFNSKDFITEIKIDYDDNSVWITCGGFTSQSKVYHISENSIINESFNLMNIPVNTIEFLELSDEKFVLIGTDFGVFYKAIKDSIWSTFGTNLPNIMITQLKYSDNFGKLYASTFGRGIWLCDIKSCIIDSPKLQNLSKKEFCEGDVVTLKVLNPINDAEYKWNNGATGTELNVNESGDYYVCEKQAGYCWKSSQKIHLNFNSISTAKVLLLGRNPICKGEQSSLKAYIINNKIQNYKITWSNGDTAKTIYPKIPGKYYFKVRYESLCEAWSDTIEISEYPEPIAPQIEKLVEMIYVSNYDSTLVYTWYWDGKVISDVKTNNIRINELGDYYVITTDSNYCKNISNILSINIENPIFDDLSISISPNPFIHSFDLIGDNPDSLEINIRIYDIIGKIVYNTTLQARKGYFENKINTESWAIGSYILEIFSPKFSKKQRLIKVN